MSEETAPIKPSELPKGTVIENHNLNRTMYFKYSDGCWVEMFWVKSDDPFDEQTSPAYVLDNEESWKIWMVDSYIVSANSDSYFDKPFSVISQPVKWYIE